MTARTASRVAWSLGGLILAILLAALTFLVHDDGRGFDPGAASRGTGLQGIADRLAALGGEVTIRSAPGEGTTVTGRLPGDQSEAVR
jgi:signal transduction histidine kinase